MTDYHEVCYLAGPMSGYVDHNFPAFNACERWMAEFSEWRMLNPARFTDGEGVPGSQSHEWYMRRDFKLLLSSNTKHILRLPGWSASLGASMETLLGLSIGCKVYDYQQDAACKVLGPVEVHATDQAFAVLGNVAQYLLG